MLEAPVPLVAVQAGGGEDRPAVGVDQETGARLATRHLLELGHRTVHHVAGPADSQEARGRIEGWRAELELPAHRCPSCCAATGRRRRGTRPGRLLAERMRGGEEVTAVFVANDQMALGPARRAARGGPRGARRRQRRRLRRPARGAYFTPPLTTVRQDFAELGRRGVQLVLDRLRPGKDPHPEPRAGDPSSGPARPARPRRGDVAPPCTPTVVDALTSTSDAPLGGRKGSPMTTDAGAAITGGRTALGIELGSTRIKAVLIGPDSRPARRRQLTTGRTSSWTGVWTYSLDAVWAGRAAERRGPGRRRAATPRGRAGHGRRPRRLGDDARLPRVRRRRCAAHAVPHLAQHEHGPGGRAAQRGVRLQHPAPVERRAPLPGDPRRRGARRSAATT